MSYYPGISEERERQDLKRELIRVYFILGYICLTLGIALFIVCGVWGDSLRMYILGSVLCLFGICGFVVFDSRATVLKKS